MPCTTILVGKKASYDGSTMIARNDDSGAGHFMPKKFTILHPDEQSPGLPVGDLHVEDPLPAAALRCSILPNAIEGEDLGSLRRQ